MWTSETSKARHRLKGYCAGVGLDLGYGGDPIVPSAITIDKLPIADTNIRADVRQLKWFVDNSLDYVYSSHCLEDFTAAEIPGIIREWLRVIIPGGFLVLYLPIEQAYREYCDKHHGGAHNMDHKNDNFGPEFLKKILNEELVGEFTIEHETGLVDDYCFELVLKKKSS